MEFGIHCYFQHVTPIWHSIFCISPTWPLLRDTSSLCRQIWDERNQLWWLFTVKKRAKFTQKTKKNVPKFLTHLFCALSMTKWHMYIAHMKCDLAPCIYRCHLNFWRKTSYRDWTWYRGHCWEIDVPKAFSFICIFEFWSTISRPGRFSSVYKQC